MKALESIPEVEFPKRLCAFARDNLNIWVKSLDDKELLWRVKSGVRRARSHGFQGQRSMATFVMLMLRFSPDFDLYPPIRAILEGSREEERADRLLTDVSGEDWQAVTERYDPEAWYDFGFETQGGHDGR
ncbi:MAG: hypothetical protein ABSG03_36525 [Bryobacteraceae bacterium]